METFNIKSELVNININRRFGNLYFFGNGDYIFNCKAKGLYITILMVILSNISLCILM